MSLRNPYGDFEITDPQAMRALAHPVRLAALSYLQKNGPATATQLALHAADPDGRSGDNHPNFVHCPSETTSTEPSTTLMAVCSSMA